MVSEFCCKPGVLVTNHKKKILIGQTLQVSRFRPIFIQRYEAFVPLWEFYRLLLAGGSYDYDKFASAPLVFKALLNNTTHILVLRVRQELLVGMVRSSDQLRERKLPKHFIGHRLVEESGGL